MVAEEGGGGKALSEPALEGVEDVRVDVEPRHVGDRERTEEREPEAERRPDDLVDLLWGGHAVLDDPRGLPEHRELDAVRDEPRAVADDNGGLAERGQGGDDPLHHGRLGRADRDHLDAGHEKRGHEPVDTQEPSRVPQRVRELRDRDRRRVRRDHGVGGRSRLDLRVRRRLYIRALEDSLQDQVGAADSVRDR